jgi:hypothetical protein
MSSAIRDVGQSLLDLLRDNMPSDVIPTPIEQIALMSPQELPQYPNVRLTLFLYSIAPCVDMRNALEIPGLTEDDEAVSEPLDLYYLLTALVPGGQSDPSDATLQSQLVLGTAMRIFFDNGILVGSLLRGDLPRDEELRLTFQPITVEDLTRIWDVFPDTVLRASVSYLVTPVRLRSNRRRGGQRVTARDTGVDHLVPSQSEASS